MISYLVPVEPLAKIYVPFVRLTEILGYALALPSTDCMTRRRLDYVLLKIGAQATLFVEVNDIAAILEIVRRGLCPTIVSRLAILRPDGLSVIPIVEPRIVLMAAMVWRRDAFKLPAASAFEKIVRDIDMQSSGRS